MAVDDGVAVGNCETGIPQARTSARQPSGAIFAGFGKVSRRKIVVASTSALFQTKTPPVDTVEIRK